jgi:hypothetical protein
MEMGSPIVLFVASAMNGFWSRPWRDWGYELVDVQASNGGRFPACFPGQRRHHGGTLRGGKPALSRVLEVEGIDYDRMEVSSPGWTGRCCSRPISSASRAARWT